MFKSEFVSKYYVKGFNNKWTGEVEYTYKYRGHEYTIYVNTNKGNEPLSWQHRNAQKMIDRVIEMKMAEQEMIEYEDKKKKENETVYDCLANLFNMWES